MGREEAAVKLAPNLQHLMPKRPKLGNRHVTVDGEKFDSRLEAGRWQTLRLLERAGEISDLRRQVRFPLLVQGIEIGHYTADFVYLDRDGKRIIEDAKGFQTREFRRTAKHMAAQGDPVTVWPAKGKK